MMQPQDVTNLKDILTKALAYNSQPTEESFPELPTVLIWLRFILAVAYGIVLGVRGIKGGYMMMNILNLLSFMPMMYCRLFLGTDAMAFGAKIMFSGLLPAIALTALIWIYLYTALHEEEERTMASMLISAVVSSSTQLPPMDGGSSAVVDDVHVADDSEF